MRFGVREICNVVFRAKAAQKVGNKIFYKNEPVIYFDSLKTSSLEGQATTVYAQGGRGNARLVAWEGERTVTFTMEDALISPIGFMILSGAGLIDATDSKPIIAHVTEQTDEVYAYSTATTAQTQTLATTTDSIDHIDIYLAEKPYLPISESGISDGFSSSDTIETSLAGVEDYIYVMLMKDGEIVSEPYIPVEVSTVFSETTGKANKYKITLAKTETADTADNAVGHSRTEPRKNSFADQRARYDRWSGWNPGGKGNNVVFVDYYTPKQKGAFQIDITPDKFGGNYYVEADTLFRDEKTGIDMPATFIIPNAKVQSNFTFTMASSGDPSTFTFTMDAFPDYTRFDKTKKVLASIQVIDTAETLKDFERLATPHNYDGTNYNWNTTATGGTAQKIYFEYENRGSSNQ